MAAVLMFSRRRRQAAQTTVGFGFMETPMVDLAKQVAAFIFLATVGIGGAAILLAFALGVFGLA